MLDSDRRFVLLAAIMLVVALFGTALAILISYQVAFEETRRHLSTSVRGHAELLSVLGSHLHQDDQIGKARVADKVLALFGQTDSGDQLSVGRREGDRILVLVPAPSSAVPAQIFIPYEGAPLDPMRRAVDGHDGTMVGRGIDGTPVLAAYASLGELGIGVVAAAALSDLRSPYIQAGAIAMSTSLLLLVAGFAGFYRIGNPIQRALRESETRHQATFDYAPVGIAHLSLDGRWLQVNQRLCDILGYPRAELMTRTLRDVTHPDDRDSDRDDIRPLLANEVNSYSLERRYLRRDGETVWAELTVARLGHEAGSANLIAVIDDISARKRTEAALREQETLLRETGRMAQVGGWSLNGQSRTLTWTDEVYRIHEVPKSYELSLERGIDFFAPEARTVVASAMEHALSDGRPFDLEMPFVTAEGNRRWAHVMGRAHRDNQDVLLVSGTFQDITARKESEAALRASEETIRSQLMELHRVYDSAPVGLIHLDRERRFVRVNDRFAAMIRLPASECIGSRLEELLPDLGDRLRMVSTPVYTDGEPVLGVELQERNAEGAIQYWLASLYPLRYDDGRVQGLIGALLDITESKRLESELRYQKEQVQLLLESSGDGIFTVDESGRLTLCNTAAAHLLGHRDVDELIGANAHDVFHHSRPDGTAYPVAECPVVSAVTEGHPVVVDDEVFWRRDGTPMPVEYRAYPLRGTEGSEGAVCTFMDITERLAAEANTRLLARVFESTTEGLLITDAAGTIVTVNDAFCKITGYERSEAVGQNPRLLKSGRQDEAFYSGLWKELSEKDQWRGEVWNRKKSGEIYPEWLTISAVKDATGRTTHYVGAFSDISVLKRSAERMEYLAHHNPLTKLPNRLLFNARLRHSLQKAQRSGGKISVMFIDLDRFKQINDSLGHAAGDEVLKRCASRLSARLRAGDTVAHLGGDEFTVVMEDVQEERDCAQLAQVLIRELTAPFELEGQTVYLSASIGIALYPRDGDDAELLVRNADAAMYNAKESGRNGYRFYTRSLTAAAVERVRLESDLRDALAHAEDQLVLYYQPQIELGSGRVLGAEALARWIHPALGILEPDRFIHVAEECGLILPIGEHLLRAACRQMAAWRGSSAGQVRIAVNLASQQLEVGNLMEIVQRTLEETDCVPEQLELEVTESSVLRDLEKVVSNLEGVRRLGVHVAIDDFGIGHSSLGHLKMLPVTKLKIDRLFVNGIPDDREDTSIARAIIALARSMGLEIIAEGVENAAQANFLLKEGCVGVQGFLFGEPMPPDDFARWLGSTAQVVEHKQLQS